MLYLDTSYVKNASFFRINIGLKSESNSMLMFFGIMWDQIRAYCLEGC